MKDPISQKLEDGRRDLLDLGLRNTLLNHREFRGRGVRVVDELPSQIYRILVADGSVMTFLPVEEGVQPDSPEEGSEAIPHELARAFVETIENPSDGDGPIAARHVDTKLQTPYEAAVLQRRLLNTYYAARTMLEEQGVNVLYIALGMLNWYEAESSEQVRLAPLILVPVSLTRASVKARFKVEYTGEEIDINHSLQMKLKADFGVDFPEFPLADGNLDVDGYFDLVDDAIGEWPRWAVDRDAIALGFFSFAKLLMYKDLDASDWPDDAKPSQHEILRAILHEGFSESVPAIADGDRLDEKVHPLDLHQVCDADSSQTIALLEAKNGRNLVIQGPPGTGKSQTITNLIADAIASGKKLLFVSEKMAALEVVKRRMDDLGLGDACLELHSNKTNKKAFLEELQRTANLTRPDLDGRERGADRLRRVREKLNAYSDAIHTPVGDSGVTPYGAYGHVLAARERLGDVELTSVGTLGVGGWSNDLHRDHRNLIEELQRILPRIGVPAEHPFWRTRKIALLPSETIRIEELCERATDAVVRCRETTRELAAMFDIEAPIDFTAADEVVRIADHAARAPDLGGAAVYKQDWHREKKRLSEVASSGQHIRTIRERYEPVLGSEAWDADVEDVSAELSMFAERWWRFLSPQFWRTRKAIGQLFRSKAPGATQQLLDAANAIRDVQEGIKRLDEHGDFMRELFGGRWVGWRTQWEEIESIADFLAEVHAKVSSGELPPKLVEYLSRDDDRGIINGMLQESEQALREHRGLLTELMSAIEIDEGARFGPGGFAALAFDVQHDQLKNWRGVVPTIQHLVTWNHVAEKLVAAGLEPVVEVASSWPAAADHLLELVELRRYEHIIERAMLERPALATFDGVLHASSVDEFRKLDLDMLTLTRAYVACQHREAIPAHTGFGQFGVLKHEFEKRRKHRPIRQLMRDAGHAIQAIKPVFMMSPLSVATYMPKGVIGFDMTVFDEASQVRPVDALGAILRGRQAIVVGDSRQLPPTNFFDKLESTDNGDEESWDDSASDMESVLGLFCAKGAPDAMLRWHYRSRHESLIAVSNYEFYDDELVVFPGPDDTRQNVGLVFHHLPDTVYRRGKSAVNEQEARIVAEAVLRHAASRPDLTLGVAAFSISQMREIQDQLELLRTRNPECEGFFAAHPEEPFFVKNLENVQGDERDVIFISVGYGRTGDGKLAMNFGPLNRDGGERRLNVLISRARRRCEVFSNIRADDLDLDRARARGVAAFKTFLSYAETGKLGIPRPSGRDADSPFEESVANALRAHGYDVRHQIGSGGFFVDLAVVDPERPGRYVLGIECDGATYHRSRWARDRDRLRQSVLENLGWRIHRIWSTDWFRDPERELRRTIESVEQAIASAGSSDEPEPAFDPGGMFRDDLEPGLHDVFDGEGETFADEHGLAASARPDESDHRQYDRVSASHGTGQIVVPKYAEAVLTIGLANGQQLHEVATGTLTDWIVAVVEFESPVHVREVATRVAGLVGVHRVGSRIQAKFNRAVSVADRGGRLERRGDFLWKKEMGEVPVRDRSELGQMSKKIDRIAPEEIAEALMLVVRGGVGVSVDEAVREACRLLGFLRVTSGIVKHVRPVVDGLIADGRVEVRGGGLFVGIVG